MGFKLIAAAAMLAAIPSAEAKTLEFDYTGSDQKWRVPAKVTKVWVEVYGAGGGGGSGDSSGGGGGYTAGWLKTTPGEDLYIVAGEGGKSGNDKPRGYGGGGRVSNPSYRAGGGGGRSAIRMDATHVGSDSGRELVTAGGGGGGGEGSNDGHGGGGGGETGRDATAMQHDSRGGKGATQTGKGKCGMVEGNRYTGNHNSNPLNGGGGGGWYGGGATCSGNDKPGGGGSGYKDKLIDDKDRVTKQGATGTANSGGDCGKKRSDGVCTGGNPGGSGGNGYVKIEWKVATTTRTTTTVTTTTPSTITTTTTATSTTNTFDKHVVGRIEELENLLANGDGTKATTDQLSALASIVGAVENEVDANAQKVSDLRADMNTLKPEVAANTKLAAETASTLVPKVDALRADVTALLRNETAARAEGGVVTQTAADAEKERVEAAIRDAVATASTVAYEQVKASIAALRADMAPECLVPSDRRRREQLSECAKLLGIEDEKTSAVPPPAPNPATGGSDAAGNGDAAPGVNNGLADAAAAAAAAAAEATTAAAAADAAAAASAFPVVAVAAGAGGAVLVLVAGIIIGVWISGKKASDTNALETSVATKGVTSFDNPLYDAGGVDEQETGTGYLEISTTNS